MTTQPRPPERAISLDQLCLAALSMAAAAIHFAVMGEHFAESAIFGVFFALVAWLQAVWAVAVILRPSRPVLKAAILGNAVVVGVWIVSRTSGLPIGPDAGTPEPATVVDVFATALEIGIVVGAVTTLVRKSSSPLLRSTAGLLVASALVAVLAVTTTWSIAVGATSGHHESDEGAEAKGEAGREGYVRQNIGKAGDVVQVLVDAADGTDQVHLTFFDRKGKGLDVGSVSMQGTSPSGEEQDIPIVLLEPGHYAASINLESGDWAFRLWGAFPNGDPFDAAFTMTIGNP